MICNITEEREIMTKLKLLRYINTYIRETGTPAVAFIKHTAENIKTVNSLEDRRIINNTGLLDGEIRVVVTTKHLNGETLGVTYKGI